MTEQKHRDIDKGAIIFYREGGASVCDRRSPFFSGPPFGCVISGRGLLGRGPGGGGGGARPGGAGRAAGGGGGAPRLGRDLSQVVIIDNSPASYIFHPDNAVSTGDQVRGREGQGTRWGRERGQGTRGRGQGTRGEGERGQGTRGEGERGQGTRGEGERGQGTRWEGEGRGPGGEGERAGD